MAALKTAIHIYAREQQQNANWQEVEEEELKSLAKLLDLTPKNSAEDVDKFKPAGLKLEATRFEKIVAKLLHYNEKVNQGKEI